MYFQGLKILEMSLILIMSVLFLSCKQKSHDDNNFKEPQAIIKDLTTQANAYADSILTSLTLEERVGQCFMPSLLSEQSPEVLSLLKEWIKDYHIGGIVLLKGDKSSAKLISEIGEESKVPLFIAIDAEWGLGMRLIDAPVYPKNGELESTTDEITLYDYGLKIAQESHELGINMILGPVVDISTRKSGVIGSRSFGSDPNIVSLFGVAYAKGIEAGGVISVAKHFPGHGLAYSDSHIGVAHLDRNISLLDTVDLKPFKEYIQAGLSGIMAGHIKATALDPSGNAASVSRDILTSLLREEMGFNGLILTDAFDMGGAKGFTAEEAIRAGADIILCPQNVEKEINSLTQSVKSGQLSLSIINDRCRRILFYKFLFTVAGLTS